MIPRPICKALSTIRRRQVAHLLMAGQACMLYGAAEFSRDLDLALLPDPTNLEAALAELAEYRKPLREQLERIRRERGKA